MPRLETCPLCDGGNLRTVGQARVVQASDGTTLPYTDELTECGACGERFYTHEQSLSASRARAAAVRKHDGLLSPDEIRAVRARYGLTQEQIENVLGVGAKTVVRWERGTVCQSRAVDQLLRLIEHDPAVLRRLAEWSGLQLEPPPMTGAPGEWLTAAYLPPVLSNMVVATRRSGRDQFAFRAYGTYRVAEDPAGQGWWSHITTSYAAATGAPQQGGEPEQQHPAHADIALVA